MYKLGKIALPIFLLAIQSFSAFNQWPQTEFGIMGWDCKNPPEIGVTWLQNYKSAGFNAGMGLIFNETESTYFNNCNLAAVNGLWCFWHEPRPFTNSALEAAATNQINTLIPRLTSDQQQRVYGFWLGDEPRRSGATLAKPDEMYTIDDILQFAAAIRKANSKAVTFFNLLPYNNNATNGQLNEEGFSNWADYQNYVSSVFTSPNTSMISVDHYTFGNYSGSLTGPTSPNKYGTPTVNFYKTLLLYGNLAAANGKSFWWSVNSEDNPPFYRKKYEITANTMRFSVNAGLVYGAKGILWFCYNTAEGGNPPYLEGFVNTSGSRTDIGNWGVPINIVTANLGKELICRNWLGVYHQSTTDPTMGEGGLSGPPPTSLSSLKTIYSTSPKQFAVGVFNGGGAEYFLALNKDIANTQSVKLTFKSAKRIRTFNATTGQWQEYSKSVDNITLSVIEPGGVRLVQTIRVKNPATPIISKIILKR